MKKSNNYSPEVRERAVRMVLENVNDYPSESVRWIGSSASSMRIDPISYRCPTLRMFQRGKAGSTSLSWSMSLRGVS